MKGSRVYLFRKPVSRQARTSHLEVEDNLFAKKPKSYDEWRIPGWNERLATEFTHDRLGIVGFHTLHELRLQNLREKVGKGQKVRVAFFLDSVAIFKTPSLYHAMLNDALFKPFIVLYSAAEKSINNDHVWKNYLNDYENLTKKGFEVYKGYDDNRRYVDLSEFWPDIVIINSFSHDRLGLFTTLTSLNLNYLTCVFNYGFNILTGVGYDYHYNNLAVNSAWIYFIETHTDYGEIKRYSRHFGANTIFLGMPFLDEYAEKNKFELPDKFSENRPVVIIAPHWSIKEKRNGLARGTFHHYHRFFLELLDANTDIDFIFKPHPLLGNQLRSILHDFDYNAYLEEFGRRPNGWVYTGGDYIGLFKKASLLITDSASFIVEWLPSGAPCQYLISSGRSWEKYLKLLSRLARLIISAYYPCFSKDDIRSYFEKIMRQGWDPKKDERKRLSDTLLTNIGCSGKKIAAWLKRKITGGMDSSQREGDIR